MITVVIVIIITTKTRVIIVRTVPLFRPGFMTLP